MTVGEGEFEPHQLGLLILEILDVQRYEIIGGQLRLGWLHAVAKIGSGHIDHQAERGEPLRTRKCRWRGAGDGVEEGIPGQCNVDVSDLVLDFCVGPRCRCVACDDDAKCAENSRS